MNSIQESNTTDSKTINYEYDATGNIVKDDKHTYTYDSRNRLTAIDSNVTYQYNYDNRRVSKTVNGVKTYFVYDGHMLIGEYQLNLSNDSRQEFLYLNSTPIATLKPQMNYRVYSDHLDTSRRVATDDEDAEIMWKWESKPFGESEATGELTFNLRFPGQYFDGETGTHYNINRDYNPVTGRYIQSDPIGFDGGLNGFGYVNGQPTSAFDPNGQFLIFIGGAADSITDNVKDYAEKKYKRNSAYFYHWTLTSTIKSVIDKVRARVGNEPITLVGHSWGGDTATEFIEAYPNLIDILVTIDPVGGWMPSRSDLQLRQYWINANADYNALGGADFSDFVSGVGGKWGFDVDGIADEHHNIPAHHAWFKQMINTSSIKRHIAYDWRTPYYGVYGRGSW